MSPHHLQKGFYKFNVTKLVIIKVFINQNHCYFNLCNIDTVRWSYELHTIISTSKTMLTMPDFVIAK